jgi:isopentenyl phosphate kinase
MMIIKFGGSVITHKAKKGIYNSNTTQRLLQELRKYFDEYKTNSQTKDNDKDTSNQSELKYDLILVHGAGSFGHISAKKFHLDNGYKDRGQLIGLTEVHNDVRDLNLRFMNELLLNGFPGISVPPMVVLRNRAKIISYIDFEIFRNVLNMQCIPVTFGDVVPDDSLGFSICSGDSIIQKLAEAYKASRVIFLTDVDGLFTDNPTLNKNAELIHDLTEGSFASSYTSQNVNPDVTGGIYLKCKIALALARKGVETTIINGNEPDRFSAALHGDDFSGTVARVN